MSEKNSISIALKVIGWIIISIGIILSLVLMSSDIRMFWITILPYVVVGIVFLGFAEVIRLLHEINKKIKPLRHQVISAPLTGTNKQLTPDKFSNFEADWDFDEKFKGSVMRNYSTEGRDINNIYPTPVKYCCVVDVEGELHIVLNKNNLPIRLSESDINKMPELKQWYEENSSD
jgi:hypothetical protein